MPYTSPVMYPASVADQEGNEIGYVLRVSDAADQRP